MHGQAPRTCRVLPGAQPHPFQSAWSPAHPAAGVGNGSAGAACWGRPLGILAPVASLAKTRGCQRPTPGGALVLGLSLALAWSPASLIEGGTRMPPCRPIPRDCPRDEMRASQACSWGGRPLPGRRNPTACLLEGPPGRARRPPCCLPHTLPVQGSCLSPWGHSHRPVSCGGQVKMTRATSCATPYPQATGTLTSGL